MLPIAAAAVLLFEGFVAGAQSPDDCRVAEGVEDIWGPSTAIERIAVGQLVNAAAGEVLAQEALQIATRVWRTGEPLTLPGERFTYPAGVRVTALRSVRGEERCLRDAVPSGAGPRRGQIVPCLLDTDGDGRFESADLFNLNAIVPFVGTRPRFRPVRRVALASPVSLQEDPQGLGHSRMRVYRRLSVAGVAAVRLEVVAETALQNAPALVSYPVGGGEPSPVPAGPVVFRPAGNPRTLALVDGAVERIGGVRFQIARNGSGWTLTPLDAAFPDWLTFPCSGTQVVGRAIPL